jgi:hypothetical protein
MTTARHHELAVRAAIAGAAHDGLVNPNDVRPLIPEWVPPRAIGVIYRRLRQDGTLIEHDHVRSTDLKGRNVGKLVPRYRLARPLVAVAPEPPSRQTVAPEPHKSPTTDLGPCARCGGQTVRYGEHGAPLCQWCQC